MGRGGQPAVVVGVTASLSHAEGGWEMVDSALTVRAYCLDVEARPGDGEA